ncbi:MAG: 2-dehydropantoate 2-reductase [Terricaulis sp.]
MPRIAVIGPGAIGATIAAYLSRNADVQLSICARTPFEEIVLEAPAGTLRASPPIYLEHKRATIADWVIVATKAYDNESVSAWLPHVADAATRLAVLQNGVEHAERFHLTFDAFRILPTVIDLRSERIGPGHVRERRTGQSMSPIATKVVRSAICFRREAWMCARQKTSPRRPGANSVLIAPAR